MSAPNYRVLADLIESHLGEPLEDPDGLRRTAAAALRELEGVRRSDARFMRKSARLADELANHVVKNASYRHEIKELEELLAWAYRTEQPLEEIRRTIAARIPRKIARQAAA